MTNGEYKKDEVLGVRFNLLTLKEAEVIVERLLSDSQKHYIVTPNPEFVVDCQQDSGFLEIINNADLAIPDGVGLIFAWRLQGFFYSHSFLIRLLQLICNVTRLTTAIIFNLPESPVRSRLSGSDLFIELCKLAAQRKYRVFFLGGQEGVAERTATYLESRFPGLNIVGTYAGDGNSSGDLQTRSAIGNQEADLLFVAYGHPRQEKWIWRNLPKLNVKVAMGVGGAFDFYSGDHPLVKRAPAFLRSLGLEWFWRLILEPRKRFPRIIKAVVFFPALVYREILFRRNY
ncbi:MAG: WecB/TagA/CpsF family glycosyltransferase [bacterium]|nr:WecB/TagA/CpsF family glycosyltransferase [bacterium]